MISHMAGGCFFQHSFHSLWRRCGAEAIECPHGRLKTDDRLWVKVLPDVWKYFQSQYAESKEWKAGKVRCKECAAEAETQQLLLENRKQTRDALRNKVYALATSKKGCARLEKCPLGSTYIVAAAWVDKWRVFLDDLQMDSIESIDNSSLICEHGKLQYSLQHELQVRKEDDPTHFYVVPPTEYRRLVEHHVSCKGAEVCRLATHTREQGVTPPVITLDIHEGDDIGARGFVCNLEECDVCIKRVQTRDAELRKDFVDAELWIRMGEHTAAPTLSNYNMRTTRTRSKAVKSATQIAVRASSSTTVDQLKLLIFQAREDLEPARMLLSVKGIKMTMSEAPLQAFDVCAGDTIDLEIGDAQFDADANDCNYVDVESAASASSANASRRPERGFGGSKLGGGGGSGGGGSGGHSSGGGAQHSASEDDSAARPKSNGASGSSTAPSPALLEEEWACEACTYHNPKSVGVCSMCEAPHNVRNKSKKHKSSEEEDEVVVALGEV